jgi:hypothetical protein
VTAERFLVGDLARAGHFKPFLGAGIGFNLWHINVVFS